MGKKKKNQRAVANVRTGSGLMVQVNPEPLFREAIRAKTSKHTREAYLRHIRRFWAYIEDSGESLSALTVQNYVRSLTVVGTDKQASASTMNQALAAIKALFQVMEMRRLIDLNTLLRVERLRSPQVPKRAVYAPDEAEMMTLLNMPDAGTPRGIRTRALFRVLYYTALRANAVCSLRWGQMQKQDGQWGLMDVHTKRDKYVSPALHPEAIKQLLLWRDVYEDMVDEIRPDDPIFPAFVRDSVSFILDGDKRPQAMTRQGLWWLVRHECAVMGLDIPDGMSVGPHTFRHAFTRHARNRGAGLEQISQALNHANLGTTQNYLARFPDFDWAHHPARVLPVPEQPETA